MERTSDLESDEDDQREEKNDEQVQAERKQSVKQQEGSQKQNKDDSFKRILKVRYVNTYKWG